MERVSRVASGWATLFALMMPAAFAACYLEAVPATVAVLATAAPLAGMLLWERTVSRRALLEDQAAQAAKSSYLTDMSHELRTPLNAVIGYAELIRDEVLGPCGNAKYREFAGDIHAAATHVLDLVNDVLELSKIDSGRFDLNEQDTDLKAIIDSCQRLLQEQSRRAGLHMTLELAPDLPEVYCDPLKVKQVLLNLMSNAIKFTHRGGCVWIRAYRRDGKVCLSVADNGAGIPAHDIPRVLRPYTQGPQAPLAGQPGTGLGLPLSKRLMELHGGSLDLHSQVGIGTRVTATFPPERCQRPVTLAATG